MGNPGSQQRFAAAARQTQICTTGGAESAKQRCLPAEHGRDSPYRFYLRKGYRNWSLKKRVQRRCMMKLKNLRLEAEPGIVQDATRRWYRMKPTWSGSRLHSSPRMLKVVQFGRRGVLFGCRLQSAGDIALHRL